MEDNEKLICTCCKALLYMAPAIPVFVCNGRQSIKCGNCGAYTNIKFDKDGFAVPAQEQVQYISKPERMNLQSTGRLKV